MVMLMMMKNMGIWNWLKKRNETKGYGRGGMIGKIGARQTDKQEPRKERRL